MKQLYQIIDEVTASQGSPEDVVEDFIKKLHENEFVIARTTDLRPGRRGMCEGF